MYAEEWWYTQRDAASIRSVIYSNEGLFALTIKVSVFLTSALDCVNSTISLQACSHVPIFNPSQKFGPLNFEHSVNGDGDFDRQNETGTHSAR